MKRAALIITILAGVGASMAFAAQNATGLGVALFFVAFGGHLHGWASRV